MDHRRTRLLLLSCLFSVLSGVAAAQDSDRLEYAIVIHGGAGITPDLPEWRAGREAVLKEALSSGRKMLAEGRSSLDVVEQVIRQLEDSPYFNAGRGAVFTAAGGHELDASIMDGRTHAGGAVGGVQTVRHPISLARLVMTKTPHVLLVADGAEKFADEVGPAHHIERVPNSYYSTEYQRERLKEEQADDKPQPDGENSHGTVGCAALDREGNIAAGTSTGGLTNKRHGRIGDSPILSAGTYADNGTCGVSCTGVGEDFIRYAVAYDVSARMRYLNQPLEAAVHDVLHHPNQQVRGGIIAVDRNGHITMQFNTPGMTRAAADSTGRFEIHLGE